MIRKNLTPLLLLPSQNNAVSASQGTEMPSWHIRGTVRAIYSLYKSSIPQPPLPDRNRDSRILSKLGRALTSSCRQARTSAAASIRAPPPSGSSPSTSCPSRQRSSRAMEAFERGDTSPS